jgi:hypothetical protein
MALSTARLNAVRALVQSAPDALVMRLAAALSAAARGDPALAPVRRLAEAEADDRRARDIVLEPLQALADAGLAPPRRALLTASEFSALWRLMRDLEPEAFAEAVQAALALRRNDDPPPVFDALCRRAADALDDPSSQQAAPLASTASWSPAQRARMAKLARLTPILRQALPKLEVWARNLSSENVAVVRLLFKDAIAAHEDAGPLFMEALQVHLDEPHRIVRLISAVMDRPSDRYLASSELADIGERLLTDIEQRVQAIRRFDPGRGFEGGAGEAASVLVASNAIRDFEQWLALSDDGPWGSRIAAQKQGLALAAEARMREVEPAVAAALPLQQKHAPGRLAPRPAPRIEGYPDYDLVRRAEGLLAFLDATRTCAANAGFGALRAKVIEGLEKRLDPYVEDLVEQLRADDAGDHDRVRAYLDVAADVYGMIQGPQAAQIVRRRVAAA